MSDRGRNLTAALAYPLGPVSGLVCLWRYRDDAFVRFHAWQWILLSASILASIVLLDLVPLLGLGLSLFLSVGAVAVVLFLMWRAYGGHWVTLPLLGDIAIERAAGSRRSS